VKQEIKKRVGNNKIENLNINERMVNNPIIDVLLAANRRADQSQCHRATAVGVVSRTGTVPRIILGLACNRLLKLALQHVSCTTLFQK
jgi:hypothetical protein